MYSTCRYLVGALAIAIAVSTYAATFPKRTATITLTKSDLHQAAGKEYPKNDLIWSKRITVGGGVTRSALIDVDSKGNGLLRIGNLAIKVYDDHRDGSYYQGSMLTTTFKDINHDGYLDLIVSGIVNVTSPWKSHAITRREALVGIFLFNPKTSKFDKSYCHAPGGVDLVYSMNDRN